MANKELSTLKGEAELIGSHRFILKYKPVLNDFATFIAKQNDLRIKIKSKLPTYYAQHCLLSEKAAEQSTSEAVALYKSTIIKGEKGLVLAGGLGIDDWAFSQTSGHITSVDNDETLNILAGYNFELLKIHNINRLTATAEDFIKNNDTPFDFIYADPDRREGETRQILLKDHQPNIIAMLPDLLKTTREVWIKCSPLYDIDMAFKEVPGIDAIYCISQKSEVKEMLLKITTNPAQDPLITCVDISTATIELSFTRSSDRPPICTEIKGYFYEAGATLVKTRLHTNYALQNGLSAIAYDTPFYCSDAMVSPFMGKCLKIAAVLPLNTKQLKLYFRGLKIKHLNIKSRGIATDALKLLKDIGLSEGGEDFLFICMFNEQAVAIHCVK
ncbi:MAG: class I SAM-dependent methyltransferase [Bacteroidota bacterium]